MSTLFSVSLAAHDVACDRGGRRLFEGLSFSLEPGDALLVQGPNGTGKTSLMRQIAGLLPLAAGEIAAAGAEADTPAAELCHYVGHLNGLKASLSVRENLAFWMDYLRGDFESGDVDFALDVFGLTPIADIAAGFLSAGQKRKLALSRLFACPRPIWLLDEPSVSLDTASVARLAKAIEAHGQAGGIAIVSTHVPLGGAFTHTLDLQCLDPGEAPDQEPAS
ncbi:heme ABC exporter ATP-binding protein CcmA [Methyloceanibacter caenitepidi]|nr:heme ABC exporter ATP-binding protein CcmA [Methyloceanibacter caenitepidi]